MTAGEVYRALESAILIGDLQPRERLVEADVCRRLGVSRTLLREVFRRLEGAGLISSLPNCGAMVRDFTRDEIEEVYSVRMLLEKAAAPLIARNVTRDDVDELEQINRTFAEAGRAHDMPKMIEGNLAFHRRLALVTRNRTLCQFLEISRLQTHQARYVAWADERCIQQSLRDHKQMLAALRRGDVAAFTAVTIRHIETGKRDYQRIFPRHESWLPARPAAPARRTPPRSGPGAR